MTQLEKIKEEIERLKEKNRPLLFACASQVSMEARVKQETYDEVLSVIDSLFDDPDTADEKSVQEITKSVSKDIMGQVKTAMDAPMEHIADVSKMIEQQEVDDAICTLYKNSPKGK